jgi:hypothetical protein
MVNQSVRTGMARASFAWLGHTIEATEAFEETGNGARAALLGEADVVNQSFVTLGLRGAYQFVVGQGGLATFSGGIGWRRGLVRRPPRILGSTAARHSLSQPPPPPRPRYCSRRGSTSPRPTGWMFPRAMPAISRSTASRML